jgi:hypothetical protein
LAVIHIPAIRYHALQYLSSIRNIYLNATSVLINVIKTPWFFFSFPNVGVLFPSDSDIHNLILIIPSFVVMNDKLKPAVHFIIISLTLLTVSVIRIDGRSPPVSQNI